MNINSFPCAHRCGSMLTPAGPGTSAQAVEAQAEHDPMCTVIELRAARHEILTYSKVPGFVQALRRLERAAIAAGPCSPEAAQRPFANPLAPQGVEEAAAAAMARGAASVLADMEHPKGLSGLYADKCDECTTGVSCEEAGRCLFEG